MSKKFDLHSSKIALSKGIKAIEFLNFRVKKMAQFSEADAEAKLEAAILSETGSEKAEANLSKAKELIKIRQNEVEAMYEALTSFDVLLDDFQTLIDEAYFEGFADGYGLIKPMINLSSIPDEYWSNADADTIIQIGYAQLWKYNYPKWPDSRCYYYAQEIGLPLPKPNYQL